MFDQEERHPNCTVQILRNSATGETSIGWWENDDDSYDRGQWDMFNLITSAEYGKQCYFLQDNGTVYSRRSCGYMTVDDAYNEYLNSIEDGWASI